MFCPTKSISNSSFILYSCNGSLLKNIVGYTLSISFIISPSTFSIRINLHLLTLYLAKVLSKDGKIIASSSISNTPTIHLSFLYFSVFDTHFL